MSDRPAHDQIDTTGMRMPELLAFGISDQIARALGRHDWPAAERWAQALATVLEAEEEVRP